MESSCQTLLAALDLRGCTLTTTKRNATILEYFDDEMGSDVILECYAWTDSQSGEESLIGAKVDFSNVGGFSDSSRDMAFGKLYSELSSFNEVVRLFTLDGKSCSVRDAQDGYVILRCESPKVSVQYRFKGNSYALDSVYIGSV